MLLKGKERCEAVSLEVHVVKEDFEFSEDRKRKIVLLNAGHLFSITIVNK